MAREPLSMSNIELGALIDASNDALAEISKDVIDRPYNVDSRKVKIEITLKPCVTNMQDRAVNQPSIDWRVERSMPGCKGMTTRAYVEGDKVLINTGDPLGLAHPDQTTIFDEERIGK